MFSGRIPSFILHVLYSDGHITSRIFHRSAGSLQSSQWQEDIGVRPCGEEVESDILQRLISSELDPGHQAYRDPDGSYCREPGSEAEKSGCYSRDDLIKLALSSCDSTSGVAYGALRPGAVRLVLVHEIGRCKHYSCTGPKLGENAGTVSVKDRIGKIGARNSKATCHCRSRLQTQEPHCCS